MPGDPAASKQRLRFPIEPPTRHTSFASMDKSRPSITSLVLIPAILTLVVTGLRLYGELNDWDKMWVGLPKAGGDGALLGISWLLFIFGFWFGLRLQRSGAGTANPNMTLVKAVVALAVPFAIIGVCTAMDLIWFPEPATPGEPRGVAYFMGALGIGSLLAFVAWPRVALALLVYGLLARIPVVIVTWFAVENSWNTHHTKVPAEFMMPANTDILSFLITPQLTFWPMITIVFGTACAALAARVFAKGKSKG
jgi:hypothetical protein